MAQVIWSKLAIKDVENIHTFIAKDSPFYAQQTVERFFARVKSLSKFPELGRQVPEYMRKDIRELIEGNYRIFYKVGVKDISIARVHQEKSELSGQAASLKSALTQKPEFTNPP